MNRNSINNNNAKTINKNVSGKVPNITAKGPKRKPKTKTKSVTGESDTVGEMVTRKQTGKIGDALNTRTPIILGALDADRPDMKKIGRSNSFFLTRKLSKLITTITGSRENINEIKEEKTPSDPSAQPLETPFKFTRSRSMISLRKSTRRSVLEPPQLEKLSEEAENFKSPTQSAMIEPPPSPSLFESLKRTFSNSTEKRRSSVNPRWSASLLNLQEIDNMVSYEDLSFVNYDKFNEYEKQLEKRVSQQDLTNVVVEMPPPPTSVVVRRRKKIEPVKKLGQANLVNIEDNFDQRKNLYRQSIDAEKLQHINDVQRDSYRWSQGDEVDASKGNGSTGSARSSKIEGVPMESEVESTGMPIVLIKRSVSLGEIEIRAGFHTDFKVSFSFVSFHYMKI